MIKPMQKAHMKDIMNIWLQSNLSAHPFIPAQYWYDNRSLVEHEYLPGSKTFVFEEDRITKAFISIIEPSFIGALFVAGEFQSQGIGKKLIDHCKGLYQCLGLAVYKENERAVKFYKNCGFRIQKEQPNDDSGYAEYLMSWQKQS